MTKEQINVAVGVNTASIFAILGRIATLMEASVSNRDMVLYQSLIQLDIVKLLHDALLDFVSSTLGYFNCNVGFDHYLQEYFPQFAAIIETDPIGRGAMSANFSLAVRELYSVLSIAQQQIDSHGYMVESSNVMINTGNNYIIYCVTGVKVSVVEAYPIGLTGNFNQLSELGTLLQPN